MPTKPDQQIKLVSWNVQKRVERALERQLTALREEGESHPVDLVALQEITEQTAASWREGLRRLGLTYCTDTSARLPEERTSINLLASRWPLERIPATETQVPFPEKVLSAVVSSPYQAIELHVAHLPAGVTWPEQKQLTNEAIYGLLGRKSLRPRILCGDFNAPKAETTDGRLITHAGSRKDEAWERWDRAERGPLEKLREFGVLDVFRDCHGYSVDARTYVGNRENAKIHRYDHMIASEQLKPWTCDYRHEWREWQTAGGADRRHRLSDHSGVIATFSLGPGPVVRRRSPSSDAGTDAP